MPCVEVGGWGCSCKHLYSHHDGDGAVGSSLIDDRIGQRIVVCIARRQGTGRRRIFIGRHDPPGWLLAYSFTAFTVMVMVAVLLSNKTSLALKVNVAVSVELAFGT